MSSTLFFLSRSAAHRDLHSFPTRRSSDLAPARRLAQCARLRGLAPASAGAVPLPIPRHPSATTRSRPRSEEHTSELQSRRDLVCRLLLEKKTNSNTNPSPTFFKIHAQKLQ